MTRFFYRDPIAAAWMARQFGMRFRSWEQEFEFRPDDLEFAVQRAMRDERLKQPPIRVHPDSVGLLEPREGDLVFTGLKFEYELVWRDHKGLRIDTSQGTRYPTGLMVIQRNGKPFIWPEAA
ncbi:hypothetical protein [Fimbriiglobus ruber]|uniref:hypothetical protein n=1 Tax=Fimbriiglobus ruber TaxID=1908690 RepID=UPI00117AEE8A|nr:hypothetical protein [Fimbriiglobus ruber]